MRMRLNEEDEFQQKARLQKEFRESGIVPSSALEEPEEKIDVISEFKFNKKGKGKK